MCRKSKIRSMGANIRCGGLIYLVYAVLVLIMAAGVPAGAAVPITVQNYSFELPGNGKIIGWDMVDGAHYESGGGAAEVPGWESDGLSINDSGVETGWTPTNGTYTGFMKATDPNVYNLTNFLIGQGDVFQLQVDARNTWQATNFRLSLYYDNNGKRTTVATSNVAVTSTMQTFSLTFTASTVPACYGHEIGIEFDNTSTTNASWDGFDNVRLNVTSNLYRAMNPYPAHKGFYGGTSVTLTWTPGTDLPTSPAPTYKVYLHQDKAKVDSNDASAYKGTRDVNNCYVSGIVQGATYYWRIDTVSGANTYQGSTWKFTTIPQIAYNPDPATGAIKVPVGPIISGQVSPVLSWQKGTGAVKGHRVYFSDSFDAVNNAATGSSVSPPFRAYLSDVNDTNWAPSESGLTPLATSKTYYWRIDEVQSTSPQTIHKGTVWSFTTVPIVGLGLITREVWENITGTAVTDLTSNTNYPDNPTTTNYPTSFDGPRRWSQDYGTRIHGWLYIEDTNDYTFWLCADNVGELWLDNVLIASNSATGYHQWDMATQSAPIHLEAGNLYYIMALQKQGADTEDYVGAAWSTSTDDTTAAIIPGTSLLPFEMYARVWAFEPNPANGATDTRIDPNLTWRPGAYADKHDIYFGTNFNDVNNASISTAGIYKGSESDITYTPGTLEFNTTYYWRIDEVNDVHPDKLWKGPVWSFTTGNFLVVDDFEDYDDTDNRIYNTWGDYFVNNTGMTVGHLDPPFAEQGIFRSGHQSMYMHYDNDGTVNEGTNYEKSGTLLYSEAERQWTEAQDWTKDGVKSLTLWFRGIPASVGSFTAGPPIRMTAGGADIWGTSDQFHFAYKQLSGAVSITARVISLTNTHNRAKAGVMIRETLAADSAHTMVCFNPEGRIEFIQRPSTGATSVDAATALTEISTPVWVRLTRSGNTFTAESSANGTTWTTQGSVSTPMQLNVYIGLIACSHNVNATCTAEFSDVSLPVTATGEWKSQDIGIQTNTAENLYIVLQDSAGNSSAVIKYSDPAATAISTWTPCNIPLADFAGVNLLAIKKITIGVGDRTNTQPVGEGVLYIDDIRLHRP